jgi:hydrogenase nickel incorporation protein HypA/HybF
VAQPLKIMHELSIVLSIVDIAAEQVHKAGARQVDRIDLEIGLLAGIEFDALDFAWDVGVQRSVLEGAERHIHKIPARGRCMDCGHEFGIEQLYEPCPSCGQFLVEVVRGKELRVKSLEVS